MGVVVSRCCTGDTEEEAEEEEPRDSAPVKSCSSDSECASVDSSGDEEDPIYPVLYFVVGGPGCGKGTQCEMFVKALHSPDPTPQSASFMGKWAHVSVGKLLRERSSPSYQAAETGSSVSQDEELASALASGQLVNPDLVRKILDAEIDRLDGMGYTHILVDGYPREQEQIRLFEELRGPPKRVLYIACSTSELRRRLLLRGAPTPSSSPTSSSRGRPPLSSARSTRRPDDTPETIDKRITLFQTTMNAVVTNYDARALLTRVDGEGSPEKTQLSFMAALKR